MRLLLTFVLGLFSYIASGQDRISDSLLYELTKRTILEFTSTDIKIYKSVTLPTIFWDIENKKPKTGKYLSDADLGLITKQINNPIIKTWDVEVIRKMKNVRLINKLKGNNYLVISLPIISSDQRTVYISYESVDKRAGAGFLTIWRKIGDEWSKEKDEMIWITIRESASTQQNVSAMVP